MKFLLYFLCGILLLFFPQKSFAATPGIVTTTVDQASFGSACTLRDAITALNSGVTTGGCDPAPDRTITFDTAAMGGTTITLNGTALPNISSEVIIDGEDTGITLDANNLSRHITIPNNLAASISVNGITFINGSSSSGGAINGVRPITITNCIFRNNTAPSGLAVAAGGLTIISNSTFSEHIGTGSSVVIVSGGAGITISNSTFSNNSVDSGAGAVFVNSAPSTITNSTFYNNSGGTAGGAIVNARQVADANMVLTNNTFVGNSSSIGGTILSTGTGAVTTMNENIIEKDSDDNSCSTSDIGIGTGSIVGSNNSTNDPSCTGGMGFTQVSDLMLGALANNGGDTETVLPETGSPVIDAVDPIGGVCLESEDQRGVTRPQGAKCDIGSVEVEQSPAPVPTPTAAPSSSGGSSDPCPGFTVCPNAGPTTEMTAAIGTSGNGDSGEMLISDTSSNIDLTVSVQETSPTVLSSASVNIPFPWQQGFNTVSEIFNFSAVSSFNGYPVTTLEHPATIILSYDPAKLNGRNPNSLRIAYFDEAANRWKTIAYNTVLNTSEHTIANTTTVFSYYTVVYPRGGGNVQKNTIQSEKILVPKIKPVPKQEMKSQAKIPKVSEKPKEKKCFLWICF